MRDRLQHLYSTNGDRALTDALAAATRQLAESTTNSGAAASAAQIVCSSIAAAASAKYRPADSWLLPAWQLLEQAVDKMFQVDAVSNEQIAAIITAAYDSTVTFGLRSPELSSVVSTIDPPEAQLDTGNFDYEQHADTWLQWVCVIFKLHADLSALLCRIQSWDSSWWEFQEVYNYDFLLPLSGASPQLQAEALGALASADALYGLQTGRLIQAQLDRTQMPAYISLLTALASGLCDDHHEDRPDILLDVSLAATVDVAQVLPSILALQIASAEPLDTEELTSFCIPLSDLVKGLERRISGDLQGTSTSQLLRVRAAMQTLHDMLLEHCWQAAASVRALLQKLHIPFLVPDDLSVFEVLVQRLSNQQQPMSESVTAVLENMARFLPNGNQSISETTSSSLERAAYAILHANVPAVPAQQLDSFLRSLLTIKRWFDDQEKSVDRSNTVDVNSELITTWQRQQVPTLVVPAVTSGLSGEAAHSTSAYSDGNGNQESASQKRGAVVVCSILASVYKLGVELRDDDVQQIMPLLPYLFVRADAKQVVDVVRFVAQQQMLHYNRSGMVAI